MTPNFYSLRARHFAGLEETAAKQANRYTWLRLMTIVGAIAAGASLYAVSPWLAISVAVFLLIAFAFCLKKHLTYIRQQEHYGRLRQINEAEAACIHGDFSAYDGGEQYIDHTHDYSSDLDIFGTHSLFRYLNRTTSPSGSNMLAQWLLFPAPFFEIGLRQEAVSELASDIDLRQNMQAIGLAHKEICNDLPGFLQWLHSNTILLQRKNLLTIMRILPWLTLASIAMAVVGWIHELLPWLFAAVHLLISVRIFKQVNVLHQQISRKVEFVSVYSGLIALLHGASFSSAYLRELNRFFAGGAALRQIRLLQRRIQKLDYRLNMLYAPYNLLFFIDYKHLVWLEKWRLQHAAEVEQWFESIAKIEALSCFANLRHNHPDWASPVVTEAYFHVDARELGHPLILEKERVCNDFSLHGPGRVAIVTGSNMSGKSTFERSIGVNMVLALAGAPVCAASFQISHCSLYTYMRIADNLEEHTSSFYAELKRLKKLIEMTREGRQVFFLLDEVLRGTNSHDRRTGSIALIRQLARQGVSGLIATHDLALGELASEMPQLVGNYHFDIQITGEEMSFDYKLHPGICTSMNASILMRRIGIDTSFPTPPEQP